MEEKKMSQEEFMNIKLKDTGIYNPDYSFYNYGVYNSHAERRIDTIKDLYDLYDIVGPYFFLDLGGFIALLNFKYLNRPIDNCRDTYASYGLKLKMVYNHTAQKFGFNPRQSNFLMKKRMEYQKLNLHISLIDLIKTISQADVLNTVVPNIVDVAKLNVMSFEMNPKSDYEPKIIQTPEEFENEIYNLFLEQIEYLNQQLDKEISLLNKKLISQEIAKLNEVKKRTLKRKTDINS